MTLTAGTQLFPQVSGYTITEQLYEGSRTCVYRALENTSQCPVVIKLLQQDYPTFNDLLHFRNQYTVAKSLKLPNIVRPYSLEVYGNSYALVMEDFGAISLRDYAQEHSLPLSEILAIALQLTDILHGLHQQRVIHKDIKPANILIHPDSKQIHLIDFSIASLLPRETQEIQNPNRLEGTLAYLAPEQTGRMNRGIDYRSDFYAFGVTLYELLTRQLPFQVDDPMELVHCHLAKSPVAPSAIQPDIPETVSKIVLKLMAKNAEERYQSALGLKHDLEMCLRSWKITGEIAPFELGTRDISDRFNIPEKLYGREVEVQTLLRAFDRVSQGTSELLLVAGFSGIGKTAVVNEVHKPIVRQRGYFIKGKFDQFNRNIPFSAFVQAFRDLMGQLLSESDEQLQIWKAEILEALGKNAQVLIEVIPELERLIGAQLPAPELSGTAAQNRFNSLFQKFIQVFTTPEHPLVIFLDDLQWADLASLKLMQLLMDETSLGYLLLIGAYRDNEVFPAHPLMLTLQKMGEAETTVNSITLQPLSQISLNQLVADTLNCAVSVAQQLSNLVYQKTQGNPFFATQFLKVLHQDQYITFDLQGGHWQCDITRVREATLTDDVVTLMAQQLQKLSDATQKILKLAACIGNEFDLNTLSVVSERSPLEIASDLWLALQEGLLLPIRETYKFFQSQAVDDLEQQSKITVPYKFLHDRVQQAAYSLIPDDQKQVVHLSIGRHLLHHVDAEQLEDQLFDIVNQLNMGRTLITDDTEQENLLRLNLRAGQKAIATTAYDSATSCLQCARSLLKADSWKTQYDLALACYTSLAEANYLNGNLAEMETLAGVVITQAQTLLDTAKVHEVKIDAYTDQGEFTKALKTGLTFLQSFGIEFPSEPNDQDFVNFFAETQQQLAGRSTEELLALPTMTSLESQTLLRMLIQVGAPAYLGCPSLYPLICFKQVQLSVTHGNILASAFSYVIYGLLLCSVIGDIKTGYEFGQLAQRLLERFDSQEYTAKVLFASSAFTEHWTNHARTTLQPLQEAYTTGLKVGDLTYAGYAASSYISYSYHVGQELTDLEMECRTYCIGLENIKQQAMLVYTRMCHQAIINLLGHNENPTQLTGEVFDERIAVKVLQQYKDVGGLWHFHVGKLTSCTSTSSLRFQLSEVDKVHRNTK